MKPFPRLYAPTVESKRAAARAIYAQGWRFTGNDGVSLDDMLEMMADDRVTPHDHVYLHDGDRAFCVYSLRPDHSGIHHTTQVNSLSHFISYCKSLGDRGPKTV